MEYLNSHYATLFDITIAWVLLETVLTIMFFIILRSMGFRLKLERYNKFEYMDQKKLYHENRRLNDHVEYLKRLLNKNTINNYKKSNKNDKIRRDNF